MHYPQNKDYTPPPLILFYPDFKTTAEETPATAGSAVGEPGQGWLITRPGTQAITTQQTASCDQE